MSVRAAQRLQMAASSLYRSDANSSLGKHACVCARMHTGPKRETQVCTHTHAHRPGEGDTIVFARMYTGPERKTQSHSEER